LAFWIAECLRNSETSGKETRPAAGAIAVACEETHEKFTLYPWGTKRVGKPTNGEEHRQRRLNGKETSGARARFR